MVRAPLLAIVVLALSVAPARAICPVPVSSICTVVGNECRITAPNTISNGCVLDFTTDSTTANKIITITRPGKLLTANTGDSFTVKAAQLRVQGTIQAYGGTVALSAVGG